jgi:hypothetical protein
VSELEQDLLLLRHELALPPEPDLRRPVLARIERRHRRRVAVLALAALVVVALATALAVPEARSALQRWLRIGVVRVELVDELPQARIQSRLLLGDPVVAAEAARRFGHAVELPRVKDLGPPDRLFVFGSGPSRRVTALWGSRSAPKLLLQQFRGTVEPEFAKKLAAGGTDVRFATVNGRPAVGLFGAPHYFMYLDPETHRGVTDRVYLVGNVLLWQSGELTLRLEGDLDFTDMLRLARRTK